MSRIVVCLAVVVATTGCTPGAKFRKVASAPSSHASASTRDSLEEFMDVVRAKSERARPSTERARTIEGFDQTLAKALQTLTVEPSAASHRAVASNYVRLGILDVAHEHFSAAVALDPRDAASLDGLARIWRDWGFPHLALPDAYRALHYAPDSPSVHNTLGTVLQALGRRAEARAHFEKALALDVTAAYALSNLCYGWMLEGDASKAADACRQALRLQPNLEAARNNLALAYEVGGDSAAALETLAASGDEARVAYNQGILHLASHRYQEALKAFDTARAARPRFRAAEAMARQTRAQLHEVSQP